MSTFARVPACVVAPLCLPCIVAQQQGERTVTVTVTASGDRSVYFDHGRDVGLAAGSFVRLFPPGAGAVEVEVRAVTRAGAGADLPPGVPLPPVGTRGEARVRPPQPAPVAPGATVRDVPEHPPWTRSEEPRAADQPLLVPTFGQRPDQRPATFGGRTFASLQYTQDRGDGRASDYLLARLGVGLDASNVLGSGELWQAAGEVDVRQADTERGDHVDDFTGRLDLLSVEFGAEAWSPVGVVLGRFFSRHLPEIGLVDGAEVVLRTRGGLSLGGGAGAYPRPFPARDAGDDLGAHVFADWTADAERSLAGAAGFQKTWHLGTPDRDLLLLRAEWRPADRVWLLASAKVDAYTGADEIKGRGVELTEAMVQARCDGDVLGTGITGSHFTWPELLREEYVMLPEELVRDGFVDRLGWSGSWRAAERLSLRALADAWRDQDRDGTTFGGDVDWRQPWGDSSALSLSAFVNQGGYTTGPGLRAVLRDRLGDVGCRAAYRWYRYELADLVTGPETWQRQSVELGASWPIGDDGDLDLSVERWFGDREDATSFGLYMQWRF